MIGITGSLSSGKSSVLKYLQEQNYKTFSSDNFVKELYKKEEIRNKVLKIFPELEEFNKEKIAKSICFDEKKRELLENFIHPLVINEMNIFENNLSQEELGFAEVPLLFEKGLESFFTKTILVSCKEELRLQRAISRGISREVFYLINGIQMSDEEKRKKTDFIIDTDVDYSVWQVKLDDILKSIKMGKM